MSYLKMTLKLYFNMFLFGKLLFKEAMGDVLANHFQDVRITHWSPLDLISVNHFETTPILCRHCLCRRLHPSPGPSFHPHCGGLRPSAHRGP